MKEVIYYLEGRPVYRDSVLLCEGVRFTAGGVSESSLRCGVATGYVSWPEESLGSGDKYVKEDPPVKPQHNYALYKDGNLQHAFNAESAVVVANPKTALRDYLLSLNE